MHRPNHDYSSRGAAWRPTPQDQRRREYGPRLGLAKQNVRPVILFLDFDGVLHPEYVGQATPADVVFCHLLRFEGVMRDHPGVDIVISSTWREQFPLTTLRARFSPDIAARIIGATPVTPDIVGKYTPSRREGEILAWLRQAGREHEPWLALDDAAWQFQQHRDRLVVCTGYVGFDDAAEAALREMLRASP